MSIYIPGTGFATQGPCPDGFHVPLMSEWTGLYTIMSGLGLTTGNDLKTNLHLPFAGFRDYSNSNVGYQDSYGEYWSSTNDTTYIYAAKYLLIYSSATETNNRLRHSYGISIRPFKDSFVAPTSSWTVIQGTIGGAGIFRNQTDGIISITSNGTTGYTMSDKNLGATAVYNNGDTLSESNCGKYYQWGNNYGFPRTGSVTTSSTQVDANTYGPGNYYSSSTFITGNDNWDSSNNSNLRGGVTGPISIEEVKNIYLGEGKTTVLSDMQGPCPDGFHVPLTTEWQAVYDAGVSLGAWTSSGGTNFITYLKIPMAGYRAYDSSAPDVGSVGRYWSSSPYLSDETRAFYLYFVSWSISPQSRQVRIGGYYVRGFKDSPTVPTSSWTTLYQGSGSAGIFHNPTDGLISISSDGTTWYTLMDKNLGATTVYNYGNTLTDANCGNVFQRGNNYAFPGTKSSSSINTSPTQVNTAGYGPGNYYSSPTFITTGGSSDWSNPSNNNLRGGTSQGSSTKVNPGIKEVYIGGPTTIVVSDMQGPAPEGFHVPLSSEWQAIYNAFTGLGLSGGTNFSTYLKLPMVGWRNSDKTVYSVGDSGLYWSSSPYDSNANFSFYIEFSSSNISPQNNIYRSVGLTVRCVKNSPTIPTSSWTTLYQGSGGAGIYHNPTDGLISISSDGTTWYTLMDKNLGATVVYNYGDTLTNDNCGNVFQRGNNYAFPGTKSSDSITSTKTRVDTTGYGPGNYYESSTWIRYSGDWSNPNNNNLRGGVTQGSSTKTVYNKIRPKE